MAARNLGDIEYGDCYRERSRVWVLLTDFGQAHNSLCKHPHFQVWERSAEKKISDGRSRRQEIGAWSLTEPEAGSARAGTGQCETQRGTLVTEWAKTFNHQRPLRNRFAWRWR